MRALILALCAALAPSLAPAQDVEQVTYVSGDGVTYTATPVEGGVALHPSAPAPEALSGALFLLPDCTANDERATGSWGQANGGFLVTLSDRTVGFPRQELAELAGADCPL